MTSYATKDEKVSPFSLPNDYTRKMKEQPAYKWYKPILALLLALLLALVFTIVVEVPHIIYESVGVNVSSVAALDGSTDGDIDVSAFIAEAGQQSGAIAKDSYMDVDFTDPWAVLFSMLEIIILLPAIGLALKAVKLGGLRSMSSVEGGLRWKRVVKLAIPLFVAMVLFDVVETVISLAITGSWGDLGEPRFAPLALLVILLAVPFQAATEEYVFRGYLLQTFGSWIPVVIVPIILSSLLFAMGHGYDLLGNVGIFISGLVYAWFAVKTGGLEASICLHACNNTVAMMMTSVFASTAATTTTSIESFVVDLISVFFMAAVAYFVCKRNGYLISDEDADAEAADAPKLEHAKHAK